VKRVPAAARAEQIEMLALDFREQKRLGDAIQDTGGWTAAAALFEPRVPS